MPAFDSLSLHSVASEEFMESDDELISINSDSNISAVGSLGSAADRCGGGAGRGVTSSRSKRKRTTTLSADLEVESLLSASGDDSLSSCCGDDDRGDNLHTDLTDNSCGGGGGPDQGESCDSSTGHRWL